MSSFDDYIRSVDSTHASFASVGSFLGAVMLFNESAGFIMKLIGLILVMASWFIIGVQVRNSGID